MNTDRCYCRVFQGAANALGLDPTAPVDRLYTLEAYEIKALSHRLDGCQDPHETGQQEQPPQLTLHDGDLTE